MRKSRAGVVAAEAAVALPLVIVLMLGCVELCGGISQSCRVRIALHECAKVAARGESTSVDVAAIAQNLLGQDGITEFTIQVDVIGRTANVDSVEAPAVTQFIITSAGVATEGLEEVPRGTLMNMSISCPRPTIAGSIGAYLDATVDASCVFVKEV